LAFHKDKNYVGAFLRMVKTINLVNNFLTKKAMPDDKMLFIFYNKLINAVAYKRLFIISSGFSK
jgi:hypothetical protein